MNDTIISKIAEQYNSIYPYLDERAKRMWVANETRSIGRGGINAAHKATSLNRKTIRSAIKQLIDPMTRGEPNSPLRWTCKSLRKLASELKTQGHQVGITTIRKLLKQQGYSSQANSKTHEGTNHPDCNEQFEYINKQVMKHIAAKQPVISVDTKKKENPSNFSNKRREYQLQKNPVKTNMHDFLDPNWAKRFLMAFTILLTIMVV